MAWRRSTRASVLATAPRARAPSAVQFRIELRFWKREDRSLYATRKMSDMPEQIAVSPDGALVAVGCNGGAIEVWAIPPVE